MSQELEWKLSVPSEAVLDRILAWPPLRAHAAEEPRQLAMQTSYFDTPERLFSRLGLTVRRRMENEVSVVCVKAPLPGADRHARAEWETPAPDVEAALPALQALGAPTEWIAGQTLLCVARAAFTRRAMLLRFSDGSAAELALDCGALYGPTQSAPLCELELEMKQGAPAGTLALLAALRAEFGLIPQERSKYARAKSLG